VKRRKKGLTLIEMMVVLGIIAILVGMLIPAMTVVKNTAKEAKQKAQFSAINLALVTFKNDYGDYPPSNYPVLATEPGRDYCGAQKLAEALLGWDLLGFHPKTAWRGDGLDELGGNTTYDPIMNTDILSARDLNADGVPDTLKERKNRYIDLETANAFKLGNQSASTQISTGLYNNTRELNPNTYVLCDMFKKQKIVLPVDGKTTLAGSPILYYKADPSQTLIKDIYKVRDNDSLVYIKDVAEGRNPDDNLGNPTNNYEYFYNYIRDPKVDTIATPYRPDSYILISAGLDGIYGTPDDIRNFGE